MKTQSPLRGPVIPGLVLLSLIATVWFLRDPNRKNLPDSSVAKASPAKSPDGSSAPLASFTGWLETYSRKGADADTSLLAEGLKIARERRVAMEDLMDRDPRAALSMSVSLATWQSLPPVIQAETEEPFSAMARYRVMPVCLTGLPDAERPDLIASAPDSLRWVEVDGHEPSEARVFGRRSGMTSKESAPVQGIRLGKKSVLREEVFQELRGEDIAMAEKTYPIANPVPDKDFATGGDLRKNPVVALAGGKLFKFADRGTLESFDKAIAELDDKPGPKGGAALLFQPFPADGSTGFDLAKAVAHNNSLASAWTETKKKVFMIRCDFSDKPNASFPVVNAGTYGTLLNTTVSNAIRDYSYGKTWIEATVSSDITRLPQTSAYYATITGSGSSRNDELLNHAKAAYQAAHPTFVPSSYDIIGIWFVSIGMSGSNVTYAGLAGGGDLWIQGNSDAGVHVHEFGHNYGVGHSSFWVRPPSSTNPVDPAGSNEEYGDPFDVMGDGPVTQGVFHAEAKQRLNWLSTGQWVDATAAGSATHRLYQIDHPNTTGTRGLRVTKSGGHYYWLSYRRLFQNAWLHAGANIVWQRSGQGRSWLIDTTPGSLSGSDDRTDGSLAIGRTYSDGNAHITPIARGGDTPQEWLDVRVNTGPFAGNLAPTVTLAGPSTVNARQTTVFTAQATDGNGDALAYSWDFGQGFTFDNNPKATFSWSSSGTYTVRVTVSDMKGMTAQATKTVTVIDGSTTWAERENTSVGTFYAMAASPTKVIATGTSYEPTYRGPVAVSTDGTTWNSHMLGLNQQAFGACWDGSQFILVGMAAVNGNFVGQIFTSTTADSGSWVTRLGSGPALNAVATGNGVTVAVGDNGTILRSTNGTAWTPVSSGTTNTLGGVAWGDGKFVAVGYSPGTSGTPVVLTSPNGTTWTNTTSTAAADIASWQDLRSIIWGGDRFIASGWYGRIRHSTDGGLTFPTTRPSGEDTPALAYGNGLWFAAGLRNTNSTEEADVDLISSDGANWIEIPTPSQADRYAAIFFNNTFITAGEDCTIRQSGPLLPDAAGYHAWRELHFPDHPALSTPDADFDGDGVSNIMEYALGTSPLSSAGADGTAGLPKASFSTDPLLAGRVVLDATLRSPIATDLVHVIEASPSLTAGSWQTLATKTGTGPWVWNAGGTSRIVTGTPAGGKVPVKIGDSVTTDTAPARFLRMQTRVNQ